MRDKADEIPATGIEAYVTGTTALNIDTADQLERALPKYVAVVVGLALLLLMVVFRSILVPVKAAAGFLLSIARVDGARRLDLPGRQPRRPVRRRPGRPDRVVPAGAADRDPVRARDGLRGVPRVAHARALRPLRAARESIVTGYGQSGRVVIAAAAIMIAVFGAFILDPDPMLKSIGLSLAFGVLADAFVVRMTLVPAVMALLGRRAWWLPKRLDRLVPTSTSRASGSPSPPAWATTGMTTTGHRNRRRVRGGDPHRARRGGDRAHAVRVAERAARAPRPADRRRGPASSAP